MTPEERFERIEGQMEFLAQHQAQVFVAIDRHSEQIGQLGDLLLRTARFVEDFARRTEERLVQLADGQIRLTEAQQRTDEKLNRLAEAQQRTDERINILIDTVERHFSDGRRQ